MIPKVQTWRVRFTRDGKPLGETLVETVNRRFARWLAYEKRPEWRLPGVKTKVSRMR